MVVVAAVVLAVIKPMEDMAFDSQLREQLKWYIDQVQKLILYELHVYLSTDCVHVLI